MKKDPIKVIPLEQIQLNEGQIDWLPRNPRTWTQTDIDRTKRSLDEDPDFMQERPILAVPGPEKNTFVAFCGNLRLTAARALGWPGAPVVVYRPEDQIDRETVIRRAVKDNGSFGSWDTDELASWPVETFELEDWGVPEWITGGAGSAHQQGSGASGSAGAGSAQEDDFDENKDGILIRCKKGDIWELGDHRLMCGDSTDLDTVKSLMGGGLADMVFTDPPYGVTQQKWDIVPNLDNMFSCMLSVSREDAALLIFSSQPFTTDLISARKDLFRYDIIWRKTAPTGFYDAHKRPLRIHEIICVFFRKQPCFFPQKTVIQGQTGIGRKRGNSNYMKTCGGSWRPVGREKAESYEYEEDGTRYPTSVIECSNWNGTLFGDTSRSVVHPTQKPVAMADYMLKTYSQEGDIVLDLFGGSGTTLIAAEQLGRKCYMMEIDPHYCDVILARWEKLTGKNATKLT